MSTRAAFSPPFTVRVAVTLGLAFAITACDELDRMRERGRAGTPHERYTEGLHRAGLDSTALGRGWIAAARHVMVAPVPVELPFSEAVYFPSNDARAVGYRITGHRGQRLVLEASRAAGSGARVVIDIFSVHADGELRSVRAGVLDSVPLSITRENDADTAYVIRVQPELLSSARVTLRLRVEPILAFPIPGATNRNMQSFWGASRDGGRRSHQGIDIMAPRGTPVLAVAPGYISHVGTSRLGGNVVFLRDERRQNIYYAHLDTQLVRDGERVRVGDTIGTVGTTGNARGGPPHLHFGIYRRGQGAIDPLHFIRRETSAVRPLVADTTLIGELARVTAPDAEVRGAPDDRATVLGKLAKEAPVEIEGASGSWFRVRLENGSTGYVAARSAGPATQPLRTVAGHPGDVLRERPDTLAVAIATVDSLSKSPTMPVFAAVDGFYLVRTERGATAWLRAR